MQNRNIASSSITSDILTVGTVINSIKELFLSQKSGVSISNLCEEINARLGFPKTDYNTTLRLLSKNDIKLIQMGSDILLVTSKKTSEQLENPFEQKKSERENGITSLKDILQHCLGHIFQFKTDDFTIHAKCKIYRYTSISINGLASLVGIKNKALENRLNYFRLPNKIESLLDLINKWQPKNSPKLSDDDLQNAFINYVLENKNLKDNPKTRESIARYYLEPVASSKIRSLEKSLVLQEKQETKKKDQELKQRKATETLHVEARTPKNRRIISEIEQVQQIHLPLGLKLDRTARSELINYAQQRSVFFQQRSDQQQVLDIQNEIQNFINLKTR